MEKGKIAPVSPLIHNILLPDVGFLCLKQGSDFSLRDKRLFEITEVEIARVDCISIPISFIYLTNNQTTFKFIWF